MSQENINISDIYSTDNLALAATLSLWYPLDSIDRTHSRKVKFVFIRNEQLDELLESFWKKEVQVEPLAYFNQLKLLKSRIYGD